MGLVGFDHSQYVRSLVILEEAIDARDGVESAVYQVTKPCLQVGTKRLARDLRVSFG